MTAAIATVEQFHTGAGSSDNVAVLWLAALEMKGRVGDNGTHAECCGGQLAAGETVADDCAFLLLDCQVAGTAKAGCGLHVDQIVLQSVIRSMELLAECRGRYGCERPAHHLCRK